MTLFDLTPLTPAEVVRHKGRHPATMLALDPDEAHTCGNCARRRYVWIVGRQHHHGDRWETVCDVVNPTAVHFGKRTVLTDLDPSSEYCDEDCCCAECCAESARDVADDGFDPHPPWPWESAVEDWMPACERWCDLEAERVLHALKGKR